ncbi:alpha/beta hydrolase [Methylobacterium nonmethylotrophicum]|uniref:Alpha/beta fold hydrolase n=1 Tax=Methylobacterium nonmethylotrophicum TaxID=1141884 RepID=A0A4Z0NX41_9HYPH|nr:alpha/beta fold hydrolase [Methylobacterium nonmethylotrophicum]TGE01857.1 alpha/beta fold hydrolase [Methylobacterium nonmethylotrophicum]
MKALHAALVLALLLATGLRGAVAAEVPSPEPPTFAVHRRDALQVLQSRRKSDEAVTLNAPREWRPAGARRGAKPTRGILLVHGLGDSPWSFHDVARDLAAAGYLVRTVLLPGHGTHPEDLLGVDVEQWRQVVREQAEALRRDVGQVYLGGFSTGANLVTDYAYANDDVAGLVLFSPAFKSDVPLDWLTPLAARFRPWLLTPDGRAPLQNEVRYLTVPTNGFAQFYHSSRTVRRRLGERPFGKPVFMVVARHDSVLDADYLLDTFRTRFPHPASRLVWYGEAPARPGDDTRILVRSDRLPEWRISQFSHMGILFNPSNRLYGDRGTSRICWNGQDTAATLACERGAEVWYSDWGYREPNKIHARLTFNPYFAWQSSIMRSVLEAAAAPLAGWAGSPIAASSRTVSDASLAPDTQPDTAEADGTERERPGSRP